MSGFASFECKSDSLFKTYTKLLHYPPSPPPKIKYSNITSIKIVFRGLLCLCNDIKNHQNSGVSTLLWLTFTFSRLAITLCGPTRL